MKYSLFLDLYKIIKILMVCAVFFVLLSSCQNGKEIEKKQESEISRLIIPDEQEPADTSQEPDTGKQAVKNSGLPAEPKIIQPSESKVNKLIAQEGDENRFLTRDSFVTKWNILGPFRFDLSEYRSKGINQVIHTPFLPDEKNLNGSQKAPKGTNWQLALFPDANPIGNIDLNKVYGKNIDDAAAYAISYLDSPEKQNDLILYTGGSDFIKIWINGKLVHTYNRKDREGRWDQDAVKGINLKKGYNLVVIKTAVVEGGWDFYFRLATSDDVPLKVEGY